MDFSDILDRMKRREDSTKAKARHYQSVANIIFASGWILEDPWMDDDALDSMMNLWGEIGDYLRDLRDSVDQDLQDLESRARVVDLTLTDIQYLHVLVDVGQIQKYGEDSLNPILDVIDKIEDEYIKLFNAKSKISVEKEKLEKKKQRIREKAEEECQQEEEKHLEMMDRVRELESKLEEEREITRKEEQGILETMGIQRSRKGQIKGSITFDPFFFLDLVGLEDPRERFGVYKSKPTHEIKEEPPAKRMK